MCAMTGLNIQSPACFGYGVIIWQVFIRMLGYYGIKASVSQVVYINVIAHLLRNLEFVLKRSRTMCAMTGFNILSLAPWGEGVRRTGGQAGLEVRKVRSSEDRLFTVKSLSSYPPTLLSLSSDNPLPCPPPREGACSCKTNLQANNCHCERQNGASHCPRNDMKDLCKPQVAAGTATFPRNDLQISCKTQVVGAAATLPHRGEGISNYNQIIYNNQSSTQPSPTGEEVSNYKMLKQVQHDTNSSKGTYSPIHLFSYSPCKRCAFTLAEVLITLGIIGVVAAMTMPSLIANHREKQIVAQLKKTYSVLQQAFLQAEVKHGEAKYWGNIVATETGETDENGDPIKDYSTTINVLNHIAENMNVQRTSADLVYTPVPMNGSTGSEARIPAERYLKLNDGTIIGGGYSSAERTTMDINVIFPKCLKRGKCKYGIDIFYFKIDLANSRILPFGLKEDLGLNINSFEERCNKSIEHSQQGFGCTAWVLYNENMDYLHCDDLSWEGKTKCN